MYLRIVMVNSFLAILSFLALSCSAQTSAVPSKDEIASIIASKRSSLSSVQAKGETVVNTPELRRTVYFEAACQKDRMYYVSSQQVPQANNPKSNNSVTNTMIYDGKDTYSVIKYSYFNDSDHEKLIIPNNISRSSGNMLDSTISWLLYCVYGKPVEELLSDGSCHLVRIEQNKNFGRVFCFQVENIQPWSITARIFLSERLGFMPVRTETDYTTTVDAAQAEGFKLVGGFWMPQAIVGTRVVIGTASGRPEEIFDTRFTNIRINHVPASLFTVPMRPGDAVRDNVGKTYWRVGPNHERLYKDISNGKDGRAMSLGWLFMASATSLILLGFWAFLQWQRRHAAV